MEKTKKGDFVDVSFTGYANGIMFDSNVAEDLSKANVDAKPKKLVIAVGKRMVIEGLDEAFIDKEIGKDYEVEIGFEKGFGDRNKELVRTMPLKIFHAQKINPQPGMTLYLDNHTARVVAVSGARVLADFNNPLAGKNLHYKFKINRIVNDEKEKVQAMFEYFVGFVPEFEVKGKVVIKGAQQLEGLAKAFSGKFKEILGKELDFELKETKKEGDKIKEGESVKEEGADSSSEAQQSL